MKLFSFFKSKKKGLRLPRRQLTKQELIDIYKFCYPNRHDKMIEYAKAHDRALVTIYNAFYNLKDYIKGAPLRKKTPYTYKDAVEELKKDFSD